MKKILIPIVMLALILLMGSCQSMRHYTYFQNIDSLDLTASRGLPDIKIMPKDELSIIVRTTNPDAAEPFNLFTQNSGLTGSNNNTNIKGYLVDNDGCINFPVVGRLAVGGLTKSEVEDLIKEKIAPYLAATENPVVIVRMQNFHVTLIGETGSKVIESTTEKMSIIDALAQGGDITQYGKRTNVLLIREDAAGQKSTHRYNLNDGRVFNDPYYYLKQNDIIYVQPTKQKTVQSSMGPWTNLWLTVLGWMTSVASVVLLIVK